MKAWILKSILKHVDPRAEVMVTDRAVIYQLWPMSTRAQITIEDFETWGQKPPIACVESTCFYNTDLLCTKKQGAEPDKGSDCRYYCED